MSSAAVVKRTAQETRDLIAAHRALLRESLAAALVAKREARTALAAARAATRAAGQTPSRSGGRSSLAPPPAGFTATTASHPPRAPRAPRAPRGAGQMLRGMPWTDEQTVALAVAIVDYVHLERNRHVAKGSVYWSAIYRDIYNGKMDELKSRVPLRPPKHMGNARHLRKRAVRIGFLDDEFRPTVKAHRVAAAAKATGMSRDAAWAAAAAVLA